jgi:hypothetical protein
MIEQPDNTDRHNPAHSPEQLVSIYPTPKTYDEMLEKRQKLNLSKPKINLHKLTASIAIRTYALLSLLAVTIILLIPKAMSLGVISGVFFSFFLALIWLSAALWQLSAVAKPFYFARLNLTVFILVYSTVAVPLAYGLLSLAPYVSNVFIVGLLATIAHFGLCYVLMGVLTRNDRQDYV